MKPGRSRHGLGRMDGSLWDGQVPTAGDTDKQGWERRHDTYYVSLMHMVDGTQVPPECGRLLATVAWVGLKRRKQILPLSCGPVSESLQDNRESPSKHLSMLCGPSPQASLAGQRHPSIQRTVPLRAQRWPPDPCPSAILMAFLVIYGAVQQLFFTRGK